MGDLNVLSLPELYGHFEATGLVQRLLELARDEDLGEGDVTTSVSVPADARAEGFIIARAAGVVAGLAVVPRLLDVYSATGELTARALVSDGERVAAGTKLAVLSGAKRALLAVERPLLNLIGHLSGVATMSAAFVAAVGEGVKASVYDTRKTMPGMRVLEKYAVRCGGARCHRIGLHDAVLIKDNHIAGVAVGSLAKVVAEAAQRARTRPGLTFVEVEVDSLDQLSRILTIEPGLVDIVLLDNMSPIQLRQAVSMRDKAAAAGRPVELEASGGVRLETVRTIAETGVDRISAGAITHSATWLDVALDIEG